MQWGCTRTFHTPWQQRRIQRTPHQVFSQLHISRAHLSRNFPSAPHQQLNPETRNLNTFTSLSTRRTCPSAYCVFDLTARTVHQTSHSRLRRNNTSHVSRLAPYKGDVCRPAYVVHALALEPKVKTNKTLMCEECSWACSSEILPRQTPSAGPLSGCDSRWSKRQSEGSGACFAARVRTPRTKG